MGREDRKVFVGGRYPQVNELIPAQWSAEELAACTIGFPWNKKQKNTVRHQIKNDYISTSVYPLPF